MASRHIPVFALIVAGAAFVLATQSPIDIKSSEAKDAVLPPLTFKHYHLSQSTYYLANTGHGCQITLKNWLHNPKVKGGPLPKSFVLEQVHFHWGKTDGVGSEHYFNGEPASMEAHLVYWNSKYKSFAEAATKPDGLAVLGFFLECGDCFPDLSPSRRRRLVCGLRRRGRGGRGRPSWLLHLMCGAGEQAWRSVSSLMTRLLPPSINVRIRSRLFPTTGLDDYKNLDFQKLVNVIPKIASAEAEKVESNADLLAWATPGLTANGYYTYNGSLTTEPYSENVIWVVYENPIVIGKSQIAAFRAIENHHNEAIATNFRSLQDASSAAVRHVASDLRGGAAARHTRVPLTNKK